jgi:hypothetical protein
MCACLCAAVGLQAAERTRGGPRADFMAANPCPANGKSAGACPGYVIDHIIALPCGGADEPGNMQWQTVAEAKAKDRWETIGCRKGRRPQMVSGTAPPVEVFPCCVGDGIHVEPLSASGSPPAMSEEPAPPASAGDDAAPE